MLPLAMEGLTNAMKAVQAATPVLQRNSLTGTMSKLLQIINTLFSTPNIAFCVYVNLLLCTDGCFFVIYTQHYID